MQNLGVYHFSQISENCMKTKILIGEGVGGELRSASSKLYIKLLLVQNFDQ